MKIGNYLKEEIITGKDTGISRLTNFKYNLCT